MAQEVKVNDVSFKAVGKFVAYSAVIGVGISLALAIALGRFSDEVITKGTQGVVAVPVEE